MLDLWPEDIVSMSESKGPALILRKQASLLSKKTNNRVEAEVALLVPAGIEAPITTVQIEQSIFEIGEFNYAFLIVAPGLGNYQYKLFTISYGINLYPIIISIDDEIEAEIGLTEPVCSESEFVEILRKIFSAKKTKKVIERLLSEDYYQENFGANAPRSDGCQ